MKKNLGMRISNVDVKAEKKIRYFKVLVDGDINL